eukprot:scaffold120112_cov33-Prasinocladus_malaysianus.AAC.1
MRPGVRIGHIGVLQLQPGEGWIAAQHFLQGHPARVRDRIVVKYQRCYLSTQIEGQPFGMRDVCVITDQYKGCSVYTS